MERLGFIHDKLDIKILILFILNRLEGGIDFDTLTELTMCDGGFGYFEYSECVSELAASGHILLDDGLYSITEKGRKNSAETESSLPFSVKVKAEKPALAIAEKQRRDAMIKTSHVERIKGGYTVRLSMSDALGEVLAINMLAGNIEQAQAIEKGFRQKAESLSAMLFDEITRDV